MTSNLDSDLSAPTATHLLGDLGRALAYHLWLILFVAVGTVVCTYVAFQFVGDEYVSTARLLVKLGRENVELPVTVEKGGLLSTGVRKEEINSEIQLIGSRPMIEATVDSLGLAAFKAEPLPPRTWFQRVKAQLRGVVAEVRAQVREAMILLNLRPRLSERDEAVLLVQKALLVERDRESDVIAVSARLGSGELAMRVVDTVVNLYLDRRVEVRRDRGMSDFFDQQLGDLRGQLGTLDAAKQNLRDSRNISAVSEERALLLGRLQATYAELSNDERELRLLSPSLARTAAGAPYARAATKGVATASGLAGATSAQNVTPAPAPVALPALSSYPNLEQLRTKVTELRLRRTEQLQKFTDGAEPVMRVEREIDQIETTLRQAITAQRADRKAVATAIEQRLQSLNSGELALEVIERDRQVLSQNYQAYAKRREEARVSEALDLRRVSNIAVLATADKPIEPVAPRRVLIVGLAFPFGLLAGLAIALLLEYLNQTIRDERDLPSRDRGLFMGWLRSERGR